MLLGSNCSSLPLLASHILICNLDRKQHLNALQLQGFVLDREEDGLGDVSTLADTSVVQQLIDLRGK